MSDDNVLRVSLVGKSHGVGAPVARTTVGELRLLKSGQDTSEFKFHEAYLEMQRRPVLGQHFEDDLHRAYTSRLRLPAFFSNLLPEGLLRELLARRAGVAPAREFFLIAELGRDLPGAVLVESAGQVVATDELLDTELSAQASAEGPLRFSVAGLQLKFSVTRDAGRWVLPVTGEGGRWYLKVPHPDFAGVPKNEFAMMRWARLVGIDVADVELVQLAKVGGLPPELRFAEPDALLVRRFDRVDEGRVHMEDFLQVLGRHGGEKAKYRATNYDSVAKVLLMLEAGTRDVEEFTRRLVFNLAIGNGDAHLKNWSLLYEDPQWPRLSPAYDLVATRHYLPREPGPALNLARTKEYSAMTIGVFHAFARRLGLEEKVIEGTVNETVTRIRDTWKQAQAELPITSDVAKSIERQLAEVPVLRT